MRSCSIPFARAMAMAMASAPPMGCGLMGGRIALELWVWVALREPFAELVAALRQMTSAGYPVQSLLGSAAFETAKLDEGLSAALARWSDRESDRIDGGVMALVDGEQQTSDG